MVPPAATVVLTIVSTAEATPPTTKSPPPRLVLIPPLQPPSPVAVASTPPSRSPMAPSASMPSLPVRRGECRSHLRTPRRGMGPWRQRRRHGRRDALVSSLAARQHGETPGSVCPGPMPKSQARACGPGHTRRRRHLTPRWWTSFVAAAAEGGGRGSGEGGSCEMWLSLALYVAGCVGTHSHLVKYLARQLFGANFVTNNGAIWKPKSFVQLLYKSLPLYKYFWPV